MWSEFSAPSQEEWLAQIAKEAAGKTPQQLSGRSWEGLIYPACADPARPTHASLSPCQLLEKVLEVKPDDRLSQLSAAISVRGPLGAGPMMALAQALKARAIELDCGQLWLHQQAAEVKEALQQTPAELEIRLTSHSWTQMGVDAVHELAWSMAGLIEVLRCLDQAPAGQLALKLCAGPRLLLEIAKFRAARQLWDTVCQAFGLDWPARIHLIQDARYLTHQDPHNNLLRSTAAAVAGLLGGAVSLELLPCDDGPDAPRWAENVVHLLRHESGLGGGVDSLAGSGAVEHLTRSLCEHAWTEVQRIEAAGGLAGQKDLEIRAKDQRIAFFDLLRRDQQGLVGVNRYVAAGARLSSPAPEVVYASTPPVTYKAAREMIASDKPLVQTGLFPAVPRLRWCQPFEELYLAGNGKKLDVLVEGPLTPLLKARKDYIQQWLAIAGMEAVFHETPWQPDQALWMLCSEEPPQKGRPGGDPPSMAGKPPDGYTGIAIYRGCDRVYCLQQLLDQMASAEKGARLAPPWAVEP